MSVIAELIKDFFIWLTKKIVIYLYKNFKLIEKYRKFVKPTDVVDINGDKFLVFANKGLDTTTVNETLKEIDNDPHISEYVRGATPIWKRVVLFVKYCIPHKKR